MVETSEAGNIGAAARAMKNMALSRLYLVKPKNFPSAVATARASGADDVLSNAIVCESLIQALDGCHLVIGASARQRSIKWQQLDVVESCSLIDKTLKTQDQEVAIIFGTENAGLTNEQLDLCQVLMTIPGNPDYFSLNIAQAIQVFSYQLFVQFQQKSVINEEVKNLASFKELENFYQHLEKVMLEIDYVDKTKPIEKLIRRIRALFNRALPLKDEVAILRGFLTQVEKIRK
ncbi:tRNA:Cm32/Um32 methyltransferase [hydrothermal vent metagenome]|uniref:tRNA:Cm32/Um32 methyltransferase n=1 Tax=hydrothermal vent metagenome TaxID=652676 RepID=A0A1W1BXH5_9ZZZZ